MKNVIYTIIALLLSTSGFKISAQVQTDKFDPSEYVYWFYLKAEKKLDKQMNRNVYIVRTLSKIPKYGAFSVYEKDTWRCLQGGQQLVIGPFRNYEVAKQAIAIYDLAKLSSEVREKEVKKLKDSSKIEDSYYCYYLKFDIAQRTHKYDLKRIPARTSVEGITLSDFLDQYLEGITMEMLAIGPFFSRPEAEESKRLNRLEEK
jgi:hypothetical protein